MNSVQTIGVIGIGTMGGGSAQICAHAGLSVSMPDVDEQRVTRGHVEAAAALAKRLGKPPVVKDSPGFGVNRVLGRDTRSTSLCSSTIRIDREIVRLAVVCQVKLLDVIRRVLQRDASVCGAPNAKGIAKLHDRMLLHLAMRDPLQFLEPHPTKSRRNADALLTTRRTSLTTLAPHETQ